MEKSKREEKWSAGQIKQAKTEEKEYKETEKFDYEVQKERWK